jgi:hypothetical protein
MVTTVIMGPVLGQSSGILVVRIQLCLIPDLLLKSNVLCARSVESRHPSLVVAGRAAAELYYRLSRQTCIKPE